MRSDSDTRGEMVKPVNHGPGRSVQAAGQDGAVMTLQAPGASSAADDRESSVRRAPSDRQAATEHASADLPGYAILTVLMLSIFFGGLAWLFRNVKSAV